MRTYRQHPRGWAIGKLLAGLALVVVCAQPGAAQQRKYLVEVSAAGAYQSFDSKLGLDGAVGGAGRVGLWLPLNFSLEAEGVFASPKTSTGDASRSFHNLGISALYNFLIGRANSAFLKVGFGSSNFGSCPDVATRIACGSSGAIMGGAGFRVALTPTILVRADGNLIRNRTAGVGSIRPQSIVNVGAGLGLSVMLGSKPILDADNDGVLDNRDRCADTPSGASVDARGCPSDADGDGVPDGVDRCPTTVAGAAVDVRGCSQDTDADNIPDGIDRCPDTPAGVLVDPRGCPKDSDGDQIPDGLDRCSDTPRGATVDALGCPGDEDGDGVLDGLDRCPRTPPGASVNATGCTQGQAPTRPAPTTGAPAPSGPPAQSNASPAAPAQPRAGARPGVAAQPPPAGRPAIDTTGRPIQQPNVTVPRPAAGAGVLSAGTIPDVAFAPRTARLDPASYTALDSLADLLHDNPSARVEIAAHTDNSGSSSDDLRLTTLQAEAVRDYLVVKGVSYQQIVARGYGSSAPLTPDTTPRGRAANRRVEIRPVAPGP